MYDKKVRKVLSQMLAAIARLTRILDLKRGQLVDGTLPRIGLAERESEKVVTTRRSKKGGGLIVLQAWAEQLDREIKKGFRPRRGEVKVPTLGADRREVLRGKNYRVPDFRNQ